MIEKIERPVCRAGTGRSDSNNHKSTIINQQSKEDRT